MKGATIPERAYPNGSKIQNPSKGAKYFLKRQCLIWNSELEWNTLKRLLNLEEEKLVELELKHGRTNMFRLFVAEKCS